ncbi:MAG: glycine C-acetyltransferase [Ruminococcaceae bacterium]|nr:glycine C-acetyltransferase [Oscillospiraceae bacterium]
MKTAYKIYESLLADIAAQGLTKTERILTSPQGTMIAPAGQEAVLNLCANNYLGLSADPRVIKAAADGLARWGFGLSSVRFICGTQSLHKELEKAVSLFLGKEDTILYSSCFDANTGLFETLLTDADAIVSDELNHASIIDGIRLCKARRYRYRNNDMIDLERQLAAARDNNARLVMIATDGVFSMDGILANLPEICGLAEKYDALVMVDDSHATGVVGEHGKGTPEHYHVTDRIDIVTGTFGKALGGGSGGYTSAKKNIIDLLRQRSRPYLFSNTLAPAIAAATLEVLRILQTDTALLASLRENTQYFRTQIARSGFDVIPGEHPIVPIMVYDEKRTLQLAEALLKKGIYVIGFTYPVVPLGKARIRIQVSAAHTKEQLAYAADCFSELYSV